MHLLFALSIAIVAASGLFLILSRHAVRIMLGVALLSAAANLVFFFAGRIVSTAPPVMTAAETTLSASAANPLPQALVLTAIVIGFSLIAFFAALILKAQRAIGTVDTSRMDEAERMGSPFEDGAKL